MFRSGTEPKLVAVFPGNVKQAIRVPQPTVAKLRAAVVGVMNPSLLKEFTQGCRHLQCFVRRDGYEWSLGNDRDVEELEGTSEAREEVFVVLRDGDRVEQPCLREFPLRREVLPCLGPSADVLTVNEYSLDGKQMLSALRKQGYFRLRVCRPDTKLAVEKTFGATRTFFDGCSADEKTPFAGATHNRLAPCFGYRKTQLSKEFFVYRNTQMLPLPPQLTDLAVGFQALGGLLQNILREILTSLAWKTEDIDRALQNMLTGVQDAADLPRTSFLEVFRYDCQPGPAVPIYWKAPRFGIPCGEHRDTSILTIVPRCRGVHGLEVFNWGTGAWHNEEANMNQDEAIVFAGELFPFFTKTDVAALCHRVVVPLGSGPRYSIPMELLPCSTPEMTEALCKLGAGLVSVNH